MFERFSTEARTVVAASQDEARRLAQPRIETGHLLLAMLTQASVAGDLLTQHGLEAGRVRDRLAAGGLDAAALATLGIDLGQVRASAERRFGAGALNQPAGRRRPSGHLSFAPPVKRALEQALRAAAERRAGVIDSAHLLLGLLATQDPGLTGLLTGCSVNLDQLVLDCAARAGRQAA